MITRAQQKEFRLLAADMLGKAGFPLTEKERDSIAVADFGLSNVRQQGAQILTLFETERISAKLIVLLPAQILPEHWHPPVGDDPGKEEILRGYWGRTHYFEQGEGEIDPSLIPEDKMHCFTASKRIDLLPADQIIIAPGTKHWMQGGPEGGIVISFSTCVRDILDQFTDPAIVRTTVVIDT
jgi:D-lyxose ketol-isomerase